MTESARKSRLPAGVWMLGLVSLFMDVSSEMIHGLLPLFLTGVVGASALTLGLIEGASEGVASMLRLFSGIGSDRAGRRKPWTVAGYGLAALTKPLFPLAHSAMTVLAARFIDRVGKGIRGAPRDALIADLVPASQRGAAFGLRQSLDTVGAFTGPLLAIALMALSGNDMRFVFSIAVIPALIAVALLVLGVKEPARATAPAGPKPGFNRASLQRLPHAYWLLLLATVPFTLARFSEAFLVLRAQSAGLALALAPLTLVVLNAVYGVSAYPAGKLSDRMSRTQLMVIGCLVLVASNACLALGAHLAWTFAGIMLWGLHLGLTEGLLSALIADHSPEALRGTAFGVMHFVRGLLLLAGSALAGALWQSTAGPSATFVAGGGFAFAAMLALALLPRLKAA
jgi:MFS family permease